MSLMEEYYYYYYFKISRQQVSYSLVLASTGYKLIQPLDADWQPSWWSHEPQLKPGLLLQYAPVKFQLHA